ncbi:MAG: CARDB domain-containing protein [Phycisphaerales bacterium]
MSFDRHLGRPTPRSLSRAARDLRDEALFEELEPRQFMAADLAITDIRFTAGATVTTAQSVIVQATLRNAGNQVATGGTLRVVLSQNQTYGDADDVLVFDNTTPAGGTDAINPIAPLLSNVRTTTSATLLTGVTPGMYFLIGHVTPTGANGNASTANDTFVSATLVTVNAPNPAPDLTVTAAVPTGVFHAGDIVNGTVTLRNQGTAASNAQFTIVGYALSLDAILGNADDIIFTPIAGGEIPGGLAAGGSTTQALQFTMPDTVNNAVYRIIAFADADRINAESNEANNGFVAPAATITVQRPDPQVTFTPSIGTIRAGQTLSGTLTARNLGNAAVDPFDFLIGVLNTTTNQFTVIQNGVLGGPDALTPTTPSLNGLQTRTITNYPVPIPATLAPGTYRFVFLADAQDTIDEGPNGENNNEVASPTTFVIQAPLAPVTTPDVLIVANVPTATVVPGQAFRLSGALANVGVSAASNVTVSLILSTNTTLGDADDIIVDPAFSEQPTSNIGSAWSELLAAPVPLNTPNGLYYVFMQVDPGNTVSEGTAGEANNVFRSTTAVINVVRPNLVGTISGPATVAAGSFITPAVTIRNAGSAAAGASHYTIALRPAGAADAAQDILLTSGSIAALGIGALVSPATGTLAIPTSVAAGPYRLVLNVDSDDEIAEGAGAAEVNAFLNTTNINITNPGNVTLADLVASVVPVTATVTPGGTLNASVRVSNVGTAAASNFTIRLFLSSNGTFDASDIEIDNFNIMSMPTPTVQVNRSITLPIWLLGSNSYIVAVVDTDNDIPESNEANNTAATASASVTVVRPTISISASDPAAAETTAPAAVNTGAFIVTRTGPTTSPLTVNYTLGGTAISGDDYTALSGTVTIPAGATSATVVLNVTNDDTGEPAETAIITLGRGVGYSVNLTLNRATITIADNEPTVTITAPDRTGTEVTAPGTQDGLRFTVTRTGPTTNALVVTYLLSGTAADGDDYTGAVGTVTIPAGSLTANIDLAVADDAIGEASETVIVTLVNGVGYGLGATSSANGTIADNEPVVTVTASDAAAAQTREGETANPGQFRFTRTGPTTDPLDVFYTVGGTAESNHDYVDASTNMEVSGMITIPAGQASVVLDISVLVFPRPAPVTAILTLATPPAVPYRLGATGTSATVTIATLPTINLTAGLLSFTPASLSVSAPGLSTDFTYGFDRTGLPGALGAFNVQIRLSQNTILGDADDVIIFTRAFAAGFTGLFLDTFTLNWDETPLVLPGFDYHVGLFVDSSSVVNEFSEVDNRLVSDSGVITFTP